MKSLNEINTENAINDIYENMGNGKPDFLFLPSIMSVAFAYHFLYTYKNGIRSKLGNEVFSERVACIIDDTICRVKTQCEQDTSKDELLKFCEHMQSEREALLSNPGVLRFKHDNFGKMFEAHQKGFRGICYDWYPLESVVLCSARQQELDLNRPNNDGLSSDQFWSFSE